jgi:hypothetical protein
MVSDIHLHTSVILVVSVDGYPAGTEAFLVDVTPTSAVVEIDRPDDNPDLVMVSSADVRPISQGSQAA